MQHAFTWYAKAEELTVEAVSNLRQQLEAAHITLNNVGCLELAKNRHIICGTDQRDQAIAGFASMIERLATAGVFNTTFTFEPTGRVWTTGRAVIRGGALGRFVDGHVLAALPPAPETETPAKRQKNDDHEEDEDLYWRNMAFFLDAIVPVLEKFKVRLLAHPNDPPMPAIAGQPCLLRTKAAFDRLFHLAQQSPFLGMEFCCGTFSEGLQLADTDTSNPAACGQFGQGPEALLAALQVMVKADKVGIVHLRNTTTPLPRFAETYIDDGFLDIADIVRVLVQGGYRGTIVLDHTPPFAGDGGELAATAFSLGYIKATIRACQKLLS